MNANIDYALANARASELQQHVERARGSEHASLSDRIRRRRKAARRARSRRSNPPRLRAA